MTDVVIHERCGASTILLRQNDRLAARHRRGPAPVGVAVLTAVAAMGFLHVRVAAQDVARAAAPTAAATLEDRVDELDREGNVASDGAAKPRRLREGARLKDCPGHFRQNGDTVTFVDDQGHDIGGLPNLNLERVIRMLKGVGEPESISWSISGTITEFSGRNYVLISRAVYKAGSAPPTPDHVEQ